jgi:hypothetical protein
MDKLADSIVQGNYYIRTRNKIVRLEDKLNDTQQTKRVFIPTAFRCGFKKAAMFQCGYVLAFIADRVANTVNLVKNPQASKGQKFRKCAVLPIKLAALSLLELSLLINVPAVLLFGSIYTAKGLIHYKNHRA